MLAWVGILTSLWAKFSMPAEEGWQARIQNTHIKGAQTQYLLSLSYSFNYYGWNNFIEILWLNEENMLVNRNAFYASQREIELPWKNINQNQIKILWFIF